MTGRPGHDHSQHTECTGSCPAARWQREHPTGDPEVEIHRLKALITLWHDRAVMAEKLLDAVTMLDVLGEPSQYSPGEHGLGRRLSLLWAREDIEASAGAPAPAPILCVAADASDGIAGVLADIGWYVIDGERDHQGRRVVEFWVYADSFAAAAHAHAARRDDGTLPDVDGWTPLVDDQGDPE